MSSAPVNPKRRHKGGGGRSSGEAGASTPEPAPGPPSGEAVPDGEGSSEGAVGAVAVTSGTIPRAVSGPCRPRVDPACVTRDTPAGTDFAARRHIGKTG